ncbi:hypothetical protein M405DRAFT_818254 [Rhizopogon salebrosus TDB-379]|nr:hypothetical protein M405DRAFT_818254 [Rhizopogon salebrosus TDB-379]
MTYRINIFLRMLFLRYFLKQEIIRRASAGVHELEQHIRRRRPPYQGRQPQAAVASACNAVGIGTGTVPIFSTVYLVIARDFPL